MEGLLQCSANYVPLTPISFLERAAFVYGNKVSIIHGNTRYTWGQTHERCLKLASALMRMKISRGDISHKNMQWLREYEDMLVKKMMGASHNSELIRFMEEEGYHQQKSGITGKSETLSQEAWIHDEIRKIQERHEMFKDIEKKNLEVNQLFKELCNLPQGEQEKSCKCTCFGSLFQKRGRRRIHNIIPEDERRKMAEKLMKKIVELEQQIQDLRDLA